jgi:hypothetical protein
MDNLDKIESESELARTAGADDAAVFKYIAEIDLYEEHFKKYYDLCDDIKNAYKDDRKKGKRGRYNVLWSNLENLKPSVLFNLPKVEIERRYKDKDPLAREASTILERASQYCLEAYPFMRHAEKARDEFLLFGRGVLWTRYVPHFQQFETKVPVMQTEMGFITQDGQGVDPAQVEQDPMTGMFYFEDMNEDMTHEEVLTDFIHRDNFGHNVCRTWDEVRIVWKKVYMTRDELVERFGDLGEKIPLNYVPKSLRDKEEDTKSVFRKAEIFEVWDKTNKTVTWLSKDYKSTPLDQKEDPLGLKNFFPCEVVFGTLETDSLVPIPDYAMYKAISDELGVVNDRISALTRAIKVTGLYPAVMTKAVQSLSSGGAELALYPVENWIQHAQSGGIKGMIDWMPIQDIANVLRSMYEVKAALKQDLYEISGQSDILRGQTDPRETATAQRGKMQFASLRLNQKQKVFSEFLRDIIQKKAEIISEQFEDMSIFQMAAIESLGPESVQAFPQAIQLLRSDAARNYRIDIETDSTIAQDNQEAQGRAVEFMNALTQGFNDSLPIIQAVPEAAEVLTEALGMVARTFKAGRSLNAAIDRMGDALKQKAAQPPRQMQQPQEAPPPPPQSDPRVIAEQIRARSRQEQLQQEGMYKQAQLSIDQQKIDANTNIEFAKMKAAQDEAKAKMMLEGIRQGHDMGIGPMG